MTTHKLVEHFFRHEYGRLVAGLARRVGVQNIEVVEDAAQSALMTALEKWKIFGLPDNPSAWLFRVAYNNLFGALRTRSSHRRILEKNTELSIESYEQPSELYLDGEVRDDLLRMVFVCCNESIPQESQLVLALKTICGFSVGEICRQLFTSEANVYKRLARARNTLKQLNITSSELTSGQYASRLPLVRKIIYLMFSEGYLSSHNDLAIRRELCEEAIRLGLMLAEHAVDRTPETAALVALMYLHNARMISRQDASEGLLLLEEQDRSLWDQKKIGAGMEWLAKSARGAAFSRYHAEARIAAEHCLAATFSETRWDKVAESYAMLERIGPSAIHRLNRAVAVAECKGAEAGLEVVSGFEPPTWLTGSYMWSAVADLHRRCGRLQEYRRYRDLAIQSAPTQATEQLIRRRLT